jgi:thymidylate synthase
VIIEGRYLDEILRKLYSELLNSTDTFDAEKGKGQDLLAPTVVLKNPRARISATDTRGRLISALGEFCWYMSGSADLDFIRFYIPQYPPVDVSGAIEDAYGPRFIGTGEFGRSVPQIDRVIDRLKRKPDTRRAVISILEPSDLEPGKKEAPCTTALQFIRRRDHLHLIAMMRSNDAYWGFPHDVFCFTMLQELVARALGIKVGDYHHFATSLHLYDRHVGAACDYLDEGFQNPTFAMPKMPSGCQIDNLNEFIEVERQIRSGKITISSQVKLPEYWFDLSLVLLRCADIRFKRGTRILEDNFSNINNDFYRNFFIKKPIILSKNPVAEHIQDELDLGVENARKN